MFEQRNRDGGGVRPGGRAEDKTRMRLPKPATIQLPSMVVRSANCGARISANSSLQTTKQEVLTAKDANHAKRKGRELFSHKEHKDHKGEMMMKLPGTQTRGPNFFEWAGLATILGRGYEDMQPKRCVSDNGGVAEMVMNMEIKGLPLKIT